MANTGNILAGTGENNAALGATAWSNPGRITADDASDANCTAFVSSQYLVARNYSFAIPAGATINGVLVRIEASEASAGTEALSAQLQDESGTLAGSAKSTSNEGSISGTTKAVYTYGSTSDVWGATLTPTIVNDADFGVRFRFTTGHNISVDYVTMAVEYTPAAVGDHPWTSRMGRSTWISGGMTIPAFSGNKPHLTPGPQAVRLKAKP